MEEDNDALENAQCPRCQSDLQTLDGLDLDSEHNIDNADFFRLSTWYEFLYCETCLYEHNEHYLVEVSSQFFHGQARKYTGEQGYAKQAIKFIRERENEILDKQEIKQAISAFYVGDIGNENETGFKLLKKDEETINLIGKVLFSLADKKLQEEEV